MTMYDVIHWNTGNVRAKCEFAACLHYAIQAAKQYRRETMDYHLCRFYGMIDMYNAMVDDDKRFTRSEREKITRLVNRIYYRTWKMSDECRQIETA